MAITNNNDFTLAITGKDLNNPNKHIAVKLEILTRNALIDHSGLLLAFRNDYGIYVFHNGTHTKPEMAQKILDAAKKVNPLISSGTLGGAGMQAGLSHNKNTAIIGGIAGAILGYSLPSIVSFFDQKISPDEGYYRDGRLVYPDKIYLNVN
ncbi:hypothetical protein [Mucilaginibacter paludis]|uniref:Uncharacterized protein n=1 Tax=Mucilaginibacter paludis DSM 18603 TaxID=714943 RepID=H1Y3J5_9SPHI|nr:hypothetical protein [Mucilaginibacter paludis]EHQ29763.1 hypothetical protein Mucpa_5694 [Mucilaginibacter paludis DSM 18603]